MSKRTKLQISKKNVNQSLSATFTPRSGSSNVKNADPCGFGSGAPDLNKYTFYESVLAFNILNLSSIKTLKACSDVKIRQSIDTHRELKRQNSIFFHPIPNLGTYLIWCIRYIYTLVHLLHISNWLRVWSLTMNVAFNFEMPNLFTYNKYRNSKIFTYKLFP